MKRARIAGAILLLFLSGLVLARLAPPIVNVADIGVTELYVDLASHGRLLVGPYSRFQWHHPGPLYFFLQAPLYVASGRAGAALFAGAWTLNVAAFGLMLWTLCAEQRVTTTVGVGAAVLVFMWRLPDVLASPWTAHVPILPFLAFVTTAAAVAAGRTRLLPATALSSSFVAQTNVALVPAVAVPLVLLTPSLVRALRSPGPAARHVAQAAVVSLVAWMPTIVEALLNGGGNVSALSAFFSAGGDGHSLREAFAAWSFSMAGILRGNLELPWGKALDPSGVPWAPAAAVVMTALAAAVTIAWMRRGYAFEAWLGTMVTATVLLSLWSLTRVLEPIGDYHVLSSSALGAVAVGLVLAAVVQAAHRVDAGNRAQRVAQVAAAALLIAASVLGIVHFRRAVGSAQRLPWAADVLPAVERIESYLDQRRSRATVVEVDRVWSQAVPIVLRLHQRHRRVAVTDAYRFMFTGAFAPMGDEETSLIIQPGRHAPAEKSAPIFDSFTVGVLVRTQ